MSAILRRLALAPAPLMLTSRRCMSNDVLFNRGSGYEMLVTRDDHDPVDGRGALAVIFGGFGFTPRQMAKHCALYEAHGFQALPMFNRVVDMTRPNFGKEQGPKLAEMLMSKNQPLLFHSISGSFWLVTYILEAMGREWSNKNVRAIVFDSCPPTTSVQAFGGWAAYVLKRPTLKPYLAHFFHSFKWYQGINRKWEAENHCRMFDPQQCVIPTKAHICLMHGRHDPVLSLEYVQQFAAFLRGRSEATVSEVLFPKARHSMAVVDYPEMYKSAHIEHLLASVPDWRIKEEPAVSGNITSNSSTK